MKNIHKIATNIQEDCQSTFNDLLADFHSNMKGDFDIESKRTFIAEYTAKEVIYKSKLLAETLINYLMSEAKEALAQAPTELFNKFFDMNPRERISTWVEAANNRLRLRPEELTYSTDPRWRNALIAGGTSFVLGGLVTVALLGTVVGAIVAGLATLLLSYYAFKTTFEKSAVQSREAMREDVRQYVESSKKQVIEWFSAIEKEFSHFFEQFCKDNGFSL